MGMLGKYLGQFVLVICCAGASASDNNVLWQDSDKISARSASLSSEKGIQNARKLTLDTSAMKSILFNDEQSGLAGRPQHGISIDLPLPNGENVSVTLEPTTLLPQSLSEKFPTIRTYKIAIASAAIRSGRLDYTNQGFHAMLLTSKGETVLIDPTNNHGSSEYLSYMKADQHNDHPHQCSTPEAHDHSAFSDIQSRFEQAARTANGMVEYRIAIAATAEYTSRQGGTVASALSAIVTTLGRVNHVYEQSLGVRLSLVENNDQIIYTQSSTDPYSNFDIDAMLGENQTNLDRVIGNSNYDIGHVFGSSGGGLAYIGSLCNNSRKAMAASGINSPFSDTFDIDFVAHELGHQFGATHTFNGILGICTTGARTARSAFEPGSGSSIMSYAGGCGTDDLQNNADAMFHSGNIQQIQQNMLSGTASSCGIQHSSTNKSPSISAGSHHTIPANTPFELSATATDADGDSLLYSWEQVDIGTATTLKTDTGNNPLFRIFKPNQSQSRSFPSMKTLTGREYINGEMLPQSDRVMKFQVAVYDGHNSPSIDQTQITVSNTGQAFSLKSPLSGYKQDSYSTINWNTANTQNAPINCSAVDLHLSTDNGESFDFHIARGISNNGSAIVYIPANVPDSTTARFKLSCSSNIFFSISSQSFSIGQELPQPQETTRSEETITTAQESSLSGGGSIGYLLLALVLLVIMNKKQTLS